jgi:hypothetical protein
MLAQSFIVEPEEEIHVPFGSPAQTPVERSKKSAKKRPIEILLLILSPGGNCGKQIQNLT